MSWLKQEQEPMQSSGTDHDTQCRVPGAPHACWVVPHPDFQEILWNDCVANVPYNPSKDIGSVNLPIHPRDEKLTLWGKTFWVCKRSDEEKVAYDKAIADHSEYMREMDRQAETWWVRALIWIFEKTVWRWQDGRRRA